MIELRDNYARAFTKRKELNGICHDLYKQLYGRKDIFEGGIEGFHVTFTRVKNDTLTQGIT